MRKLTAAESEALATLVCELKTSTAVAVATVDACLAHTEALTATAVERAVLRRSKAEQEFGAIDLEAFAQLCDEAAEQR